MDLSSTLRLLREHIAGRVGIPSASVNVRRADEPPCEGWELVIGCSSPEELRTAVGSAEFVGWMGGPVARTPLAIVRPACTIEGAPDSFRVVAVVPTYDEADILDRTIAHLVVNGLEVHVIDNWSTNGCREIAESWRGRGVVAIDSYPEEGPEARFDWQELLRRVPRIGTATGAHWTTLNDADELRESPWRGVTLRDALWHVQQSGFNCVNLTQIDFLLTDPAVARDGLPFGLPLEAAFPYLRSPAIGDMTQMKFWKNGIYEVDIASTGGHTARFPGRRVFPYNFLQRHYPYRSATQAAAKIDSRVLRQPKAERKLGWGSHYPAITPKFPMASTGEVRFDEGFAENYLVERLSAIGWRKEIEPPTSIKHRLARALDTVGLWKYYEASKKRHER